MVAAFAEIEDAGGDAGGSGEGNEFVFKQAAFELLPGYPAGDVSLRMEAKHIQKGQEEERSLRGQIRESGVRGRGRFLGSPLLTILPFPPPRIPVGARAWALSR